MSTISRTMARTAHVSAEPVIGDVIRIRGSEWVVVEVREDGLDLRRRVAHGELDAAAPGQRARDALAYGLGDTVVDGDG